jgi:hypothetical protein
MVQIATTKRMPAASGTMWNEPARSLPRSRRSDMAAIDSHAEEDEEDRRPINARPAGTLTRLLQRGELPAHCPERPSFSLVRAPRSRRTRPPSRLARSSRRSWSPSPSHPPSPRRQAGEHHHEADERGESFERSRGRRPYRATSVSLRSYAERPANPRGGIPVGKRSVRAAAATSSRTDHREIPPALPPWSLTSRTPQMPSAYHGPPRVRQPDLLGVSAP